MPGFVRKHEAFYDEVVLCSKIRFPENEASSMVRMWVHDLEPVTYLENLGSIDHCACFLRVQSQRTYVKPENTRYMR